MVFYFGCYPSVATLIASGGRTSRSVETTRRYASGDSCSRLTPPSSRATSPAPLPTSRTFMPALMPPLRRTAWLAGHKFELDGLTAVSLLLNGPERRYQMDRLHSCHHLPQQDFVPTGALTPLLAQ
jgi:hypothetical protein